MMRVTRSRTGSWVPFCPCGSGASSRTMVIASVIDEQGVRERVRAGIMKREMTEKLSWSISYSLSDRIEACADKVKGRIG